MAIEGFVDEVSYPESGFYLFEINEIEHVVNDKGSYFNLIDVEVIDEESDFYGCKIGKIVNQMQILPFHYQSVWEGKRKPKLAVSNRMGYFMQICGLQYMDITEEGKTKSEIETERCNKIEEHKDQILTDLKGKTFYGYVHVFKNVEQKPFIDKNTKKEVCFDPRDECVLLQWFDVKNGKPTIDNLVSSVLKKIRQEESKIVVIERPTNEPDNPAANDSNSEDPF